MVRERAIREISSTYIDEHHFEIKLKTQAGTYEFFFFFF